LFFVKRLEHFDFLFYCYSDWLFFLVHHPLQCPKKKDLDYMNHCAEQAQRILPQPQGAQEVQFVPRFPLVVETDNELVFKVAAA
jgi:hypothetical protein